ncbi:MAG: aliphatic sulfonate ABC transporter substrate-binding protein [Chloroflexi bacterium]|nr:aliphatic sulfonate ABC transporter substrate-binding protein [Chloroflexota bacterium]
MKRLFFVLVIIMIILSTAVACGSPTQGGKPTPAPASKPDGNYTVKIGFPSSARDTRAPDGPDIWGLEKGFFEEEFKADGIKVEYIPFLGAAPAINEALAAGSLDMAYIADIGALIGKASGLKTSLVAMGNPNGASWWLVVSPSSSIQKVTDLKGKKVATIKATAPHFYLLKALERNGLKASDIELINMTLPDSEQALRAGQIDATVTGNWFGVKLLSQGIKAIDSTKETPIGRGTGVIVATDSFIADHPTFFPRYYKARQKASDWANADRDEAFAILVKNFGGVERGLLEPLYTKPFNYDQSLSADVLARIKEGERFLRELGLTRTAVDVDGWINQSVAYKKP